MGLKKAEMVREWEGRPVEIVISKKFTDGRSNLERKVKARNERDETEELFTEEGVDAYTVVYIVTI